ncbi:hypothetical protein ACQQCD_02585 [Pseudarthrobacter sp. J1763]|uniref:hypothetical protein n=1 Tax=Pseudarthrobacter sp. J1763 TaxID=3420445 RepID=UPI003D2D0803
MAVLAVVSFALTACSPAESPTPAGTSSGASTSSGTAVPPSASVAEAFPKYDALRTELVAALEKEMPGITWSVFSAASLAKVDDGRCILQPAVMKSSADIVEPSHRFEDVFAVGDPILAEHGFPAFGGLDDVPGGWIVTRSQDAAGATVSIESKFPATLTISVPVKSAKCDPSEIPKS